MRIVERFGAADDPDYEGKLLIELYHAQFRTALSECFGPEAEPSLAAAGCGLAAQYLLAIGSSANAHQVDALTQPEPQPQPLTPTQPQPEAQA